MTTPADAAKQQAIDAWNGVLFDRYLRFRLVLTEGLAHHGDAALKRHAPKPGSRVLDIGCGFGDTTLWLGSLVGDAGRAVGIDVAPRFIDIACQDATAAGAANVAFRVADAERDDLGGPYSLVFSRFGTLDFADPVAALRNVRGALGPGGRLCLVVWRRREDNLAEHYAQQVLEARGVEAPAPGGEALPGPFAMADADQVSDILRRAGFTRIGFERHDRAIMIGRDLDDAIDFAMALGPVGEYLRLKVPGLMERAAIEADLREKFKNHVRPDGVWLPSSTWFVTAVRRERH